MFLRIARLVPGTGIVFALLVIVATALSSGSPDTDSSDTEWTSWYASAGHRHREEIAFFLVGLAALCFLQFLGSVRGALARAEGEPARITTAAITSGAAFISLAVAAHAVGTAHSWALSGFDGFTVNPDTARLFSTLSYLLFVLSLFAAAAMALAVATLAFAMRAFPAWLAWFSALAALAGLLGILFLPSLIVLAWIAALSAYLLVVAHRSTDATTAAAA